MLSIENYRLREWLQTLEGGAGSRSMENLHEIKRKLVALMYHVGKEAYRYTKHDGDPFVEYPDLVECLEDISALAAEVIIHKYI